VLGFVCATEDVVLLPQPQLLIQEGVDQPEAPERQPVAVPMASPSPIVATVNREKAKRMASDPSLQRRGTLAGHPSLTNGGTMAQQRGAAGLPWSYFRRKGVEDFN
jgi:hypothetical protein